ncbi:ATP-binding protein [Streptomyces sp. NPDC006265]|uniref:ATP-binding protein n=1 Tax=Streptomyces sp. NPDC006265 TaxID=3156740 RepID=UPI00339E968E
MTSDPRPRSMSLTLPVTGSATIKARVLTTYALMWWGLACLLDDARLVVSELMENAIKAVSLHEPQSEIGLRLSAVGGSLMIGIEDPLTTVVPCPRAGARGLRLVSGITDDWGVRQSETSKVVWASLSDEPPTYLSGTPWPAVGEPWRKKRAGAG